MSDVGWFYHLTTKQIALKVKLTGLRSARTRIGTTVANPTGSFAKNRKEMEALKFAQKLAEFLRDLMSRGCSVATVKANPKAADFVPIAFTPQGSNAVDVPALGTLVNQKFTAYLGLIGVVAPRNLVFMRNMTKVQKEEVEDEARDILLNDKNHYLARLAVQAATFAYNIEEMITATHVYFLKAGDAQAGYDAYKKHLGGAEIVVLRVHRNNLPGLIQDDSDGKAMMTPNSVLPNVIDVMVQHAQFGNLMYRCDATNWQALSTLT